MGNSVLVVDDDPLVLIVATETLMRAGFDVTVAADGNEAVRALEADRFDFLITDILMPEKDGLELIREVRVRWPATPIIAISSGGRMDAGFYLPLAQTLGVDAILKKPVQPITLLTLVLEVLTKRRTASAAAPPAVLPDSDRLEPLSLKTA